MAVDVRIRCIVKADRNSPYEAIQFVGGLNLDQSRWKLSVADAIAGIDAGKYQFYVERPEGHRVRVIVARSAAGNRYLKTEADSDRPDNLLSLPTCP